MQRSLIALVLLAACNEVYGLDQTRLLGDEVDGCPDLGTTVPAYSPLLHVALSRNCYNFTLDAQGRSAAYCITDDEAAIETGDGTSLEPAQLTRTVGDSFEDPALTPEGEHLILRQYGPGLDVNVWSMFRREANAWTFERDVVNAANEYGTLGVPSAGPDRRAMFATFTDFRELAEQRAWQPIRTSSWVELGVAGFGSQLNLSPDGLRLVFLNGSQMMYAERTTLADPFGIARPMTSIPDDVSSAVFMTRGCSRVYFSGLGSVFYQSQR